MKEFFNSVTNFLMGFGTEQPFWGASYLLMKLGTVSWNA